MSEKDAFDFTKDEAGEVGRRAWHWLIDRARTVLTVKLAVGVVTAFALAAAAAFAFPAFVAAAFAVVAVFLVGWAVQTQRLLHRERAVSRWTIIDGLRVKQREVRAQASIREATLVVAGQPGDREAGMRAYQPLVAAVRYREGVSRSALRGEASPRQRQHEPAAPKAPEMTSTKRELKDFRAEDEMIEARIQALAVPNTEWEAAASERAEEWSRAKAADLEARKRARKGQRPTAPGGGFAFEIGRNPDGTQRVGRRDPAPTPEQIAKSERPAV
jgi:hypothetical protein